MVESCSQCRNHPCVCDATHADHIPGAGEKVDHSVDVNEMVESLEHIRESLTDWDNPIGAKDDISAAIKWIKETHETNERRNQ